MKSLYIITALIFLLIISLNQINLRAAPVPEGGGTTTAPVTTTPVTTTITRCANGGDCTSTSSCRNSCGGSYRCISGSCPYGCCCVCVVTTSTTTTVPECYTNADCPPGQWLACDGPIMAGWEYVCSGGSCVAQRVPGGFCDSSCPGAECELTGGCGANEYCTAGCVCDCTYGRDELTGLCLRSEDVTTTTTPPTYVCKVCSGQQKCTAQEFVTPCQVGCAIDLDCALYACNVCVGDQCVLEQSFTPCLDHCSSDVDCYSPPVCGDGICSYSTETYSNCPQDCCSSSCTGCTNSLCSSTDSACHPACNGYNGCNVQCDSDADCSMTTGNCNLLTCACTPGCVSVINFKDKDDGNMNMRYSYYKDSTRELVESDENYTTARNISEEPHDIFLDTTRLDIDFTLTDPCMEMNFTFDELDDLTLAAVNIPNFVARRGHGIDFTASFSDGMLAFNYSGLGLNEGRIRVYRCGSWNMAGRACAGSWTKIISTVDKDRDLVYVPITSFSGYAVGESPYYTVQVSGTALDFFTGDRINGNITAIPLENPDSKNTTQVVNGEWTMSFDMLAEDVEHLSFVVEDDQRKGYNELKLTTPSEAVLNCTTQNISLSGYSIDVGGSSITSGNVRISVLDTDYTDTTTFSGGTWAIDFHPCLISGQVYTLQILVSDNTGKRGEILQKYPAK